MNPSPRIVSLVPSLTETVCELGLKEQVVGCTSFCIKPKGLHRHAELIGGTKDPQLERIVALQPTHILTNAEENKPEHIDWLKSNGCGALVWETFPQTVSDSIELVRECSQLFDHGHDRLKAWEEEVNQIQGKLAHLQLDQKTKPYLYLIWRDPWMVAGDKTYIAELLKCGSWENTITTGTAPRDRYPVVAREQIAKLPEETRFLFSSEPFPFLLRHIDEFCREMSVPSEQCLKVDGQALSWFGTGLREGLRETLRISKTDAVRFT